MTSLSEYIFITKNGIDIGDILSVIVAIITWGLATLFAIKSYKTSKQLNKITEENNNLDIFHWYWTVSTDTEFLHITFVNSSNVEWVIDYIGVKVVNKKTKEEAIAKIANFSDINIMEFIAGCPLYSDRNDISWKKITFPRRVFAKEKIEIIIPLEQWERNRKEYTKRNYDVKSIVRVYSTDDIYEYPISEWDIKKLWIEK
jgi:hypothetical protein